MRTYLDCIPCFFRQALDAARNSRASTIKQRKVLIELAKTLPEFSLNSTPPEIARIVYEIVKKVTHHADPYRKIKTKSNKFALQIYPELIKVISESDDRLLKAVELAIAGNIIDYGVKNSLKIKEELNDILNKEKLSIHEDKEDLIDYSYFKNTLKKAENILYLADNAGETVFDRILIEEIKRIYKHKKITYAVKEKPVINDALIEDAYKCGLDKTAAVVSCGVNAPGTILSLCSKKFLKIYKEADMIISKGQGNFEALSEEKRPIYFLLKAKCPVIAKDIGCNVGDIILLFNFRKGWTSRKHRK